MTTPVNRSTTSSSSSVGGDTSTTQTSSKSQTGGTTEDPAAQGAQTVTDPNQLSGISQGQIDQAMRMSGNSPYVTLRAPDGSLLVVEKNLLFAWGFASPQQGQGHVGESADPGEPYGAPPTGDEAMYQQWQDGGGVGNPQGFGTQGKQMGGGATGYYYGPGGFVGGGSTGPGGYGNPYAGYGQPGNPVYDQVFGGEQRDQIYAQRREIRKTESQLKVKMRTIMLMIMMGDVVGAMRAMVFESEKLNKLFNRTLVKQLNTVRESKAKILNAMARKDPPRAHDNTNNPQGAANDQNKQAKYTQWVSVTTQLMSEVQQTERELMDLLSEGRRNINESWEAYSGMKEAEARTTRTVIQAFRS